MQRLGLSRRHERAQDEEETATNGDLTRSMSRQTTTSSRRKPPRWWRVYWFRGMWRDVKRRAPYYCSDFLDAWDYRVVPATVYMYFAKYATPLIPDCSSTAVLQIAPTVPCLTDRQVFDVYSMAVTVSSSLVRRAGR